MNPIFFGQTVPIITVTLFGKQKKLFQWLYSESPVKNKIVLNDRWAKFTDGKKHGDYYTREYSNRNMPEDKPWEECRGMGFSFSYNQNEDIERLFQPTRINTYFS